MWKFIIFLILFYLAYKAVKFFIRYLIASNKKADSFKKNSPAKSKYQNVEEADFKEFPEDGDKKSESS